MVCVVRRGGGDGVCGEEGRGRWCVCSVPFFCAVGGWVGIYICMYVVEWMVDSVCVCVAFLKECVLKNGHTVYIMYVHYIHTH